MILNYGLRKINFVSGALRVLVITSNWDCANWPVPIWPGVLLPLRGSVVAYPQVARTERGLAGRQGASPPGDSGRGQLVQQRG